MCSDEADDLIRLIKEFPTVLNILRDGTCSIKLDVDETPVKVKKNPTLKICDCECGHIVKQNKSIATKQEPELSKIEGKGDFCHDLEGAPKEVELIFGCVKSDEKFFTPPTPNKPFVFNFAKILKPNSPESDTLKVKKLFLEALNEKAGRKYKFDDTLSALPNLAEAVRQVASETFRDNARETARVTDYIHPISELFKRTRFDCYDDALMNTLLEDAFKFLRKNPKFVLPTLPDAHKLPLFHYFVARRYGRTYSVDERFKLMHKSMFMFDSIIRLFFNKYNLKVKGVPGISIGYNYKHCVIQKFRPILKAYQERLEYLMLEQARLFWLAARPSMGLYERTRQPFYSYTPARWSDVKFFRVWRPDEYRDMTFASKRRLLEAKKTL